MISRRAQHEVRNPSKQDKQSTARINDERGLVKWDGKNTQLCRSTKLNEHCLKLPTKQDF